ncbi:MAG: NTP transferase domain-containing protein [Sediminicola sp.]|tara:strand:+ start:9230 stop:9823 length:594 start_codon:yes stop_codon:yes gene_type:complete
MVRKPLYGLVLTGGRSSRMGTDKGSLDYHGIPQREYVYDQLEQFCQRTFYSCRAQQYPELNGKGNTIWDQYGFPGPFNGLLSAHAQYPKVAWLVMACDLPFLNGTGISELISAHDPQKNATAFSNPGSGMPEPLAAIWEPSGLQCALDYLDKGGKPAPAWFLRQANVKLVVPIDENMLLNANSPVDYDHIKAKMTSL